LYKFISMVACTHCTPKVEKTPSCLKEVLFRVKLLDGVH
jgi:hypothetical protein